VEVREVIKTDSDFIGIADICLWVLRIRPNSFNHTNQKTCQITMICHHWRKISCCHQVIILINILWISLSIQNFKIIIWMALALVPWLPCLYCWLCEVKKIIKIVSHAVNIGFHRNWSIYDVSTHLPSFRVTSHTHYTAIRKMPWSTTGPDQLPAPQTHHPHSACSEDLGSHCHLCPAGTQPVICMATNILRWMSHWHTLHSYTERAELLGPLPIHSRHHKCKLKSHDPFLLHALQVWLTVKQHKTRNTFLYVRHWHFVKFWFLMEGSC
jgi:hypothetical protein